MVFFSSSGPLYRCERIILPGLPTPGARQPSARSGREDADAHTRGSAHAHTRTTDQLQSQYCELAHNYCLLGANNEDLAGFFAVTRRTVDNWIATHADFAQAMQQGRAAADALIARSLFDRAKGSATRSPAPPLPGRGADHRVSVQRGVQKLAPVRPDQRVLMARSFTAV
jgi:hypothetical protein